MRVDEKKLTVTGIDEELQKASAATKAKGKNESNFVQEQYKERTLLVKAIIFVTVFVVVVFVGIFAYQLLTGGNVEKSLEVFKALAAIASPIATLVLGYYFGSKSSRK